MNKQNEDDILDVENRDLFSDSEKLKQAQTGKPKGTASVPAASAEVDDYVFLNSCKKKKKAKKTTNLSADSNEILVRSRTKSNKKSKHSRHKTHRKKMKTWKKVLISIASVILALILIAVGTIAYLIHRGSNELFNPDISVSAPENVDVQENGKFVVYNGDTYKFNEKVTNILCIGVDTKDLDTASELNTTAGQADMLILVSIDTSTGKMTLVNISRETMTDVSVYSAGGSFLNTERQQLCLAYAYGDGKELSCENTVNSVKKVFYNIPINTYFALDLEGISAMNDSIGGVDVVSPETIGEFVEGESYHLVGDQAEDFVRLRNKAILDSNNMRMERQKIYIQSFIDKALEQTKQDFGTPLRLFNESAEYSCTNLNPSRVSYLAQTAITNGSMAIDMVSVPGTVTMGEKYAEFNVNEKEFYELFLSIYYTRM